MSLKCHLVARGTGYFWVFWLEKSTKKIAVCIIQSLQIEPAPQGGQRAGLGTESLRSLEGLLSLSCRSQVYTVMVCRQSCKSSSTKDLHSSERCASDASAQA